MQQNKHKENNKKLIAILTLLCFMFTFMPVAVFADEVTNTDTSDKSAATVVSNFEGLKTAITTSSVITLEGTIELTETLTIDKDVTITGGTITYGEGFSGTMFDIATGASLTLDNVVIDGDVEWTWTKVSGFVISSGTALTASLISVSGTLNLGNGTVIQNVYYPNGSDANNGIIHASSGSISFDGTAVKNNVGQIISANTNSSVGIANVTVTGNHFHGHNGGFVYLENSTLILASGNIYENYYTGRGGVIIGSRMDSSATMNDGSIRNNTAARTGTNDIASMIYLERGGDFTMNGGEIINNTGAKASAIASRWTDAGDTQGKTLSYLKLNAGTISGNTTLQNNFKNATIFIRHLETIIGSEMTIIGDIVFDEKTYNATITGNTGDKNKLNNHSGSFVNDGSITGNIILRNQDASDAWEKAWDTENPNGAIPGTGTLNGYILDTIEHKALAADTFIDSDSEITLNQDGTLNIPANSIIKTSDGTTYTTDETVNTDKDGNIVIPAGSSVETKVAETNIIVSGPAIVDKDGNVTIKTGGSITDTKNTESTDDDTVITIPNSVTSVTVPKDALDEVKKDTNGNITLPANSSVTLPDGTVVAGEVIVTPEGTVEVADDENISVTTPDGTSTVTGPATVDAEGNVTVEVGGAINGNNIEGETGSSVTIPVDKLDEVTADADGTVTLPAGSTVTDKNGEVKELTYGGTIAADGTVKANPKPSTGGGFSGSYNYPVSTPTTDNGSVTLSDNYATAGETVTATVTPDNGYGVAEVIVTDVNGNVIPVTSLGGGKYSFVMPAGKVSIETICKPAITLTVGSQNANVFGKTVIHDVAPIIVDGRTMLPIRFIAEALGANVAWNEAAQTVIITKDGTVVEIIIGADYAYINGKKVKLDAPAFIANGRTYLPVRFISEALGADVNWDAVTRQVVIIK